MTRWPPFSRERWLALSTYLDEALEIAPDRRAAWLAAICARDLALAVDLTSLLTELEDLQGSAFLERGLPPFGRFEDPQ